MFQPGIEAYLDAIKQQYDELLAENKALKQENSRLAAENSQYVRRVQHYSSVLNERKNAQQGDGNECNLHMKRLKRGSDWVAEGDLFCSVSLCERIVLPAKITNAVVSKCGKYVIFGCGYRAFMLVDKEIWHLNIATERMERCDAGMFGTDVQEYKICPMDFASDSQCVYMFDGKAAVRIWNVNTKVQEGLLRVSEPISLKVVNNVVYIAERDKILKVYKDQKQVLKLKVNEELSGLMIVSPNGKFVYIVVNRNQILVVDVHTETSYLISTNEERLLAIAVSQENMLASIGGYGKTAGLYKIKPEKPSCRLQDTIEQNGPVLALEFIGSHLVVGQPEGFMIWDLNEKKSMQVEIYESNVINVSAGKGCFTTIDNNGILRIWMHTPIS
ncbi:hypothetical protein CWI42_020260 [Ordospora colligata]|uniref:WD40 domain-containing protein n=1 Tax=Ordospora colligata OC4 TaxID=1354746 RepID=A0A0B2ULH6_9MICR|nr:uncharacterized protein M896_020270 [Ordospora colligata OC4]KHN70193.1 hypothetical protein M896_020270 [Ordospora colligata OC4]TBU16737.1 hypothetical protein CWI41_020280 [Ordospora colligata]TBU17043.1 hypothetical protein CWI40_020280 [Ordospora colligata]TBU19467.1 hypothetical protein CWI42_020260 [Ordospora colligata]